MSDAPNNPPQQQPQPAPPQPFMEMLRRQPWGFDFFQAVRRLENAHPELPRIGYAARPVDEPVRFCQEPSLGFAPAAIAGFSSRSDGAADRMFVQFMGLCGPNGPMPLHITQYLRDRQGAGDLSPARFFDIFNHRMISLFYRAWAVNQQTVSFERSAADAGWTRPDSDRFAFFIACLCGRGTAGMQARDAVPDVAKLHYSGRLANQAHNADGLEAILGDYFGMPVQIEQFVGQWIDLPAQSACRLGESRETGLLGKTTIVGSKVWDCQMKFRIRMGPMKFKQYQRLLPGGGSLRRLGAWVRNYVGDELEWDVQLVLLASEVPKTCLGRQGQLGWSSWIGSKPFTKDADDLKLRPPA